MNKLDEKSGSEDISFFPWNASKSLQVLKLAEGEN